MSMLVCYTNVQTITHRLSKSLIPETRFCVYWTTSEKRKLNAAPETSETRGLARFLSYMFGRESAGFVVGVVDGREKRELVVGDR